MSNANQDNLWQELTNQGHIDNTLDRNLDIKQIMDSWTLKKGLNLFGEKILLNSKIFLFLKRLSCYSN
jgi:hypothetical protein